MRFNVWVWIGLFVMEVIALVGFVERDCGGDYNEGREREKVHEGVG